MPPNTLFTFYFFDLLILIPGVHCYSVLVYIRATATYSLVKIIPEKLFAGLKP